MITDPADHRRFGSAGRAACSPALVTVSGFSDFFRSGSGAYNQCAA